MFDEVNCCNEYLLDDDMMLVESEVNGINNLNWKTAETVKIWVKIITFGVNGFVDVEFGRLL